MGTAREKRVNSTTSWYWTQENVSGCRHRVSRPLLEAGNGSPPGHSKDERGVGTAGEVGAEHRRVLARHAEQDVRYRAIPGDAALAQNGGAPRHQTGTARPPLTDRAN